MDCQCGTDHISVGDVCGTINGVTQRLPKCIGKGEKVAATCACCNSAGTTCTVAEPSSSHVCLAGTTTAFVNCDKGFESTHNYGVATVDCKCGVALIKHGQVCYHKTIKNTAIRKCKGNGAVATEQCACCTTTGSICNIANLGQTCSSDAIATAHSFPSTVQHAHFPISTAPFPVHRRNF